jgi:lysophospholipase L1-like esterase
MARKLSISPNRNDVSILKEGRSYVWSSNYVTFPKPALAENTAYTFSGDTIRPGRAIIVESIIVSCDQPGMVQVFFNDETDGSYGAGNPLYNTYTVAFGPNGGNISIPINGKMIVRENTSLYASYRGVGTTLRPWFAWTVVGVEVTNDFNYSADKTIMIAGDSTTWQSMGSDPNGLLYLGDSLYSFRLKNRLLEDGKSVRLVNKGYGGSKSKDTNYFLKIGHYDIKYDLLLVGIGMNDADSSGPTQTAFKEYQKDWIRWRNRYNKKAAIVFIAPNSTDVATKLATNASTGKSYIQSVRDWMYDVANDATLGGAANNVYFYDSSTAFGVGATPSTDINFYERTSGGRMHPSGEGHRLIYEGLYSLLVSSGIYSKI